MIRYVRPTPIISIKNLTEFGFGLGTRFYHCIVLTNLLSIESLYINCALNHAKIAPCCKKHKNVCSIRTFLDRASPILKKDSMRLLECIVAWFGMLSRRTRG